ncbi:15650_t:CDS:2 [Rhizophagus irregularis]|nr:15650_t:CDS:2 [Rhizophagus irregularis]
MPSTCRVLGRQLNIGKSTVTKTLEDLSSLRGRPRILTNNDIKYLESLLKEKSRFDIIDFTSDVKTNIALLIAADDLCLNDMCSAIEAKLLNDKELLKKNFVTITHAVNKFDHFTNLLQFYKNTLQEDPTIMLKANDFTTINREIFLDLVSIYPFKPIEVWNKLIEWAFAQIKQLPSEISICTSDNISTLKDLIQPFISHIKFKDIAPHEFSQKVKPYKQILNSDFYIEILEYYSFDDSIISKCRTDIDSLIINSEQAFLLANLIKILENPSVYAIKSGECAHFNGEDVGPNFGGKNADLALLCFDQNEGKCVKKNYETRIRDNTGQFDIDEYEVFHVNGYNCNNLLYINQ